MDKYDPFEGVFDEYDDEELHWAMLNSYDVIVNDIKIEDIVITDIEFFIHDISKKVKRSSIDILIAYFEETEEYERCAVLLKIKNDLND
jgi:hypothetical protein